LRRWWMAMGSTLTSGGCAFAGGNCGCGVWPVTKGGV
jgi:hypothetical protein